MMFSLGKSYLRLDSIMKFCSKSLPESFYVQNNSSKKARKMKGEHEDDPYMPMNRWYRRGVKVKYYDGGLLPRIQRPFKNYTDEKFQDPFVGDEKSFGDNDYIDFFTDDRIHPIENVQGPDWLRATKLHDYDILRNRVKYEGDFLKEFRPMKYEKVMGRLKYLYKDVNRRKRIG